MILVKHQDHYILKDQKNTIKLPQNTNIVRNPYLRYVKFTNKDYFYDVENQKIILLPQKCNSYSIFYNMLTDDYYLILLHTYKYHLESASIYSMQNLNKPLYENLNTKFYVLSTNLYLVNLSSKHYIFPIGNKLVKLNIDIPRTEIVYDSYIYKTYILSFETKNEIIVYNPFTKEKVFTYKKYHYDIATFKYILIALYNLSNGVINAFNPVNYHLYLQTYTEYFNSKIKNSIVRVVLDALI